MQVLNELIYFADFSIGVRKKWEVNGQNMNERS